MNASGTANESGLVRDEVLGLPNGLASLQVDSTGKSDLLAPEIQSLSFEYYDGSSWYSNWDSTNSSGPVAIKVTMGVKLKMPGNRAGTDGLVQLSTTVTLPGINLADYATQ